MINKVDIRTSAEQIIMLERGALDRWGKGDPGGFLQRQIDVGAGGTATFPAGAVHRWWNDGDETLVLEGYVKPAVDFDRYLHGAFEVLNSGAPARPPLFYMAHLAWRHRRTQAGLFMPRPIQAVVLPLIVLIGTILGRYRGTNWPGSPSRCPEAPLIAGEDV